jgi:MFS transporter, PPP family, 3-phenylpropionic acid transporter
MMKQIQTLRGLTLFYYATNAILLPFLPLLFENRGYSALQIGLLMNIGPFVSMFFQPIWGFISDRMQTIKYIVFFMWTLALIASVGLFEVSGFVWALTFVLLLYFFLNPSIPLLDSLIIKSTQATGKSYGSVRMFGSIGFTTVAVSSGYLLMWLGGVENMKYMYWTLWIIPLLLLFKLKDEKGGGPRISLKSLQVVTKNRQFLWFLLMVLILMIPHRMNDGLFTFYLNERGGSDMLIGWAWAVAALSEIPTFALLGKYMSRFNELAILGIVSVLYTLRWIAYASVSDPLLLTILQGSHSVTFAVYWMVAIQYAVRLVPEELRTTGQSLLSAVFLGLAGIIGGMTGGWINGIWGGAAMYWFGAVMASIAGVLFFGTQFLQRRKTI